MRKSPVIYLIGSLRNPLIAEISNAVEYALGCEVFSSWAAASPTADDAWKSYEQSRGNSYEEALRGYAATHVFKFDREHIERADAGLLILPAGRSGHLELGFMLGQGKPGWILRDDPERWDVMYGFATGVAPTREKLFDMMRGHPLFARVSE